MCEKLIQFFMSNACVFEDYLGDVEKLTKIDVSSGRFFDLGRVKNIKDKNLQSIVSLSKALESGLYALPYISVYFDSNYRFIFADKSECVFCVLPNDLFSAIIVRKFGFKGGR